MKIFHGLFSKLAACVLVMSLMAVAQDKPAAKSDTAGLPSAESLVDKYLAAIGGKEAVLKAKSRLIKGNIEMATMGLKGTAQIYAKAPDKMLTVIDIAGFGMIQQGYNGKIGWSQDPLTGVRELKDSELTMMKRSVEFHRDVKLKELYPKMVVKEKSKVGDAEAYVVEATPVEGTPERLFFDIKTGLLIRTDFEFEGPQGKMQFENFLEDYRLVDGVKMAFTLRQVNPAISITTKIDEVKQNVPIEDSKFEKPKAP